MYIFYSDEEKLERNFNISHRIHPAISDDKNVFILTEAEQQKNVYPSQRIICYQKAQYPAIGIEYMKTPIAAAL